MSGTSLSTSGKVVNTRKGQMKSPVTTTEAVVPADGTGIETEGVTVSTEENLPATGGAPLLMALAGAMSVGGAMLGLKKVR